MDFFFSVVVLAFAALIFWLALGIPDLKLSDRQLVLMAGPLAGGTVCASLVFIGKNNDWRGFSVSSGYWGTHFLDSMLYGMGNSDSATCLVAFIWFVYGAGIGAVT